MILPGSWCDVAPDLTVAYVDGAVTIPDGDAIIANWAIPSTNPVDVRCARNGASICILYKDGQDRVPGPEGTIIPNPTLDHVWASMDGSPWFDLCLGAMPLAADVAPFGPGFRVFVANTPHTYRLWYLLPGAPEQAIFIEDALIPVRDLDGTSQGIVDVVDGRPVWTDLTWDNFERLRYPTRAGEVIVGQRRGDDGPDALIAVWHGQRYVLHPELVFEPRVAQDTNGQYRVVGRLLHGRRLELRGAMPLGELERLPEPVPIPAPVPVPTPVPPVPTPTPTPQPPKEPAVKPYPNEAFLSAFGDALRDWASQSGLRVIGKNDAGEDVEVGLEPVTTAAFIAARGAARTVQDFQQGLSIEAAAEKQVALARQEYRLPPR